MNRQTAHASVIGNAEAAFRTARLVSGAQGRYSLDDQGFVVSAIAAFSCLVKPQAGDVVLYANTADGENVIVSIVSREGEQVMAIEFPEGASLQSRKGSISVAAERSVSLSSAKLNMLSETMVQKTGDAYLEVQEMHAQGERLNANFSRIMVLSNFISTIAKQAVNKFMTYMRRSENFDQVKAANMTRSSDGLYSVNSKQTVMLSEKDTRIDAERIHIG